MADDTTVKTEREIFADINKRLDALEREVLRLKSQVNDLRSDHELHRSGYR